MVFILDIILIFNFIVAFRCYKYLIAPPVLLGGGMMLASLVSTINYNQWNMGDTTGLTVVILGGGPALFTFFSILLFKKTPIEPKRNNRFEIILNNKGYLKFFMLIALLVSSIGVYLKYQCYSSYYSATSLPEMIYAFRLDSVSGESDFSLPLFVSLLSKFTYIMSYVSTLLLSLLFVYNIKDLILKLIISLEFFMAIFNAMFTGTKGAIMDIIVSFLILYIIILYSKVGGYRLPRKFYKISLLLFFVFLITFQGLGLLLGRQLEERTNVDILSEYCGAEIKNFDIYMHGKDGNKRNKFAGEDSFWSLYKIANSKYVRVQREFQYVKESNLGNVYTQYYSFHKDFGIIGVVLMSLLIAIISMKAYNQVLHDIRNCKFTDLTIFIYSIMAFSLFMSFFSFKFSENIFSLNFINNALSYAMIIWFMKRSSILSFSIKK